ncbi:MAG: AAA family ATPase, partial [Clostridiaceae bacterium]
MFLKSIEVKGFKSFADKTVLEFKNGVTAVVGPNGSGKSNISDAVKWVLGEQSVKSLRGSKMEDIIFSGTQYRKPVSLAYVCLSLDNSDGELPINYSQVNISRRLYRSGDSEYYINNTQCRLKDVQELFMDTGIGKEGYSIIGQGKIDKILSGKSEDRRSLLEEAAGIVKYKTRKQEAERKLQSMDANLLRINDILSTYQDRIEPLRIESEKAERFLELSSGLKQKEINLILDSMDKNNNKINDIGSKELELSQNLDNLKSQQESLETEVTSLNQGLDKIEEADKENKKSYYENKTALGELQGESNLIKDKVDNNKQYIDKSSLELTVYNDKHSLYQETYNN